MNYIAEQEYNNVLERIEYDFIEKRDEYAGYDEWEDEYSHNEIDEAQGQLIEALNQYFEENAILYIAFDGCDCVRVWKKEWYAEKFG